MNNGVAGTAASNVESVSDVTKPRGSPNGPRNPRNSAAPSRHLSTLRYEIGPPIWFSHGLDMWLCNRRGHSRISQGLPMLSSRGSISRISIAIAVRRLTKGRQKTRLFIETSRPYTNTARSKLVGFPCENGFGKKKIDRLRNQRKTGPVVS
ncbi:hypothetical protein EVAR_57597_1 [Eumeta japonica]|uniref:Uncharacterized protein n=1 Tax=Eumeta variegata TaxID=151549 RepID=A0A4C1XWD3_EUMVA|nr:hypothetical protein EVAR_57597_1 [Eumeta japonica]